jgi:TetR/AcrR family transcriptional regulator
MAALDAKNGAAERILAVAESLFARSGYDGVSMNAVAREAGVSKANVFHHFGNKEELYLAVLRNARQRLTDQLEQLGARPDSPLDRTLRQITDRYLGDLFTHSDLSRLFLRQLLDHYPVDSKVLAEKIFRPNFSQMEKLLTEAQQNGRMREDIDPALPMMLLIAGCLFLFQGGEVLRHLPGADFTEDRDEYARMIVDIVMHGITPR